MIQAIKPEAISLTTYNAPDPFKHKGAKQAQGFTYIEVLKAFILRVLEVGLPHRCTKPFKT